MAMGSIHGLSRCRIRAVFMPQNYEKYPVVVLSNSSNCRYLFCRQHKKSYICGLITYGMEKKTIWDLGRLSVKGFKNSAKLPLTVVLDNVRSLNNIGSVFRTCDAFAVERVALCGISAVPPSPEIHKTALGAEDSVGWDYYESTEACVDRLRGEGCIVCALEQVKGSIGLQDFRPEPGRRYALVLGHEVNGVDQRVVDKCDVCLEIPQRGTKHSLNVSVSGGIAIWHFFDSLKSCLDTK